VGALRTSSVTPDAPMTCLTRGYDRAVTSANALLGRRDLLRRGVLLEYLTIGWNLIEGAVAVAAGAAAGSVALVGFGVDSLVETTSGVILLWRLQSELRGRDDVERIERVERRAERFVGFAFLLLAAWVALSAARDLTTGGRPESSPIGLVLTAVSIVVMLWLARAKRDTGERLDSRALVADSRQTAACWYLSAATLVGLALNTAFGLWWADPVAALVIAALLVREGVEAVTGKDDDDQPGSGRDHGVRPGPRDPV